MVDVVTYTEGDKKQSKLVIIAMFLIALSFVVLMYLSLAYILSWSFGYDFAYKQAVGLVAISIITGGATLK